MTEVDTRGNGQVAEIRPYAQFVEYLGRKAEAEDSTRAFDVSANQMDKILSVDNADEVWDADEGGTVNGQDVVDKPLEIKGYSIAKSSDEFDAPLGVYALVDATELETGESVLVNTGAPLVIAKLRQLERFGMFPAYCVFRGTKTQRGFTVLKLRPYKPGPQIPLQGTTVTSDE